MEHVNENKPLKELAFALIGILLFVGLVALIGVSAFLRPSGDHYVPQTVAEADQVADEATNPTNQPDIPNEEAQVTEPVVMDDVTDVTEDVTEVAPTDVSETPAMLPQEGTATAEGTVSQEGAELVADTAPAELTDGDVVADTTAQATDTVEPEVVEVEAVDTTPVDTTPVAAE